MRLSKCNTPLFGNNGLDQYRVDKETQLSKFLVCLDGDRAQRKSPELQHSYEASLAADEVMELERLARE